MTFSSSCLFASIFRLFACCVFIAPIDPSRDKPSGYVIRVDGDFIFLTGQGKILQFAIARKLLENVEGLRNFLFSAILVILVKI